MPDSRNSSDGREPGKSPLGRLATEAINPATGEIDRMSSIEIARLMNAEDAGVAAAVQLELPEIARAIDAITERLSSRGRLIYIGAGSSGRIGSLDASECPATFNAPAEMVLCCVSGSSSAASSMVARDSQDSVAAALDDEDNPEAGAADVAQHAIGNLDALVGITASGRTPYVLGAVRCARQVGALTIGLACNHNTPLAEMVDIMIAPVVGPEVIAGSTRLKAGTAQKMVLNMLSTGTMILLGKTYGNMMVDVQANNEKLRERAISIVEQATGLDRDRATAALDACDHETKTAILAERAHLTPDLARERLAAYGYRLRRALEASG